MNSQEEVTPQKAFSPDAIAPRRVMLWLELTLPETLTLTHNPKSQNEIVEGHN